MRTPRLLAALGAAVLLPLVAFTAPSAQADERYTGTITESDPSAQFFQPNMESDTCGSSNPADLRYDAVEFTSQSSGPRTFVVRPPDATAEVGFGLFVYRNGACVGADFLGDTEAEIMAGITSVANVSFRKGDRVRVVIVSFDVPVRWQLDVRQPGTANAAAKGKAKKFATLPYQIDCGSKKATVKLTKKASKVRSATFKAGGKKVATVVQVKAGKKVTLKKIPASATKITAVLKLKGGGKVKVSRPYSAC